MAPIRGGSPEEGCAFVLELPSDLRELRPEDRDHLIDGFRKAGAA